MLPENRDPINFIDFQVTADGKRVEPQVEVKAIRHGVDVTEVLSGMEFRSHCSEKAMRQPSRCARRLARSLRGTLRPRKSEKE